MAAIVKTDDVFSQDRSAVGTGMSGVVNAIAISGNDVYAGGQFSIAGTCTSGCNGIAKFSDGTWSTLGAGMNSGINAIAISGGDVYAGGGFTTAETCTGECNYVAKFSGGTWSPLGTGMNYVVYAIALSGNRAYAGGTFTIAGTYNSTDGCNHIAQTIGSNLFLPFVSR